jgi:molybdopterin molybdotransferase
VIVPTVRLPGALRRYAGGAERVSVAATTVGGALDELAVRHPELGERLLTPEGTLRPHLQLALGGRVLDGGSVGEILDDDDEVIVLVGIAGGAHDVRMRGFRDRTPVERAVGAAMEGLGPLGAEEVPLRECSGRVLAGAVLSEVDVPPFRRATMDGYALRAEDTYGASAYSPLVLRVIGEAMPGAPWGGELGGGEACRIMTGAPVPAGADAVLRAEDAGEVEGRLEVRAAVPAGRNVGRVGEDVAAGTTVLPPGRRLRPQDVGLLSSIGAGRVAVHRRPVVRLVVSGDELLPPGSRPDGVRIADSNGPMLEALVERDGGVPDLVRVPDGRESLREALRTPGADVIVTAGAASVGREDHVPSLVAELGELVVHGVAMRPSSPTGIGRIGTARVLVLPGNPVSCLIAYDVFAGPVVRVLGGRSAASPYPVDRLRLGRKVVSQIGRTDYLRVRVVEGVVEPVAIGGASVLSSTTRADGFLVVPAGLEGYPEGASVEVHRYDGAAS